jgi:hypothetical protein
LTAFHVTSASATDGPRPVAAVVQLTTRRDPVPSAVTPSMRVGSRLDSGTGSVTTAAL